VKHFRVVIGCSSSTTLCTSVLEQLLIVLSLSRYIYRSEYLLCGRLSNNLTSGSNWIWIIEFVYTAEWL